MSKQETVDKLKSNFQKAKVVVLTDYRGINVNEITKLRRSVSLMIAKNTLTKRAIQNTNFESMNDYLHGQIALAFGLDETIAKPVAKFIKTFKKGEILGACLDGRMLSAEETNKLANLPTREELYAHLMSLITSQPQRITSTVKNVMTALTVALEERTKL